MEIIVSHVDITLDSCGRRWSRSSPFLARSSPFLGTVIWSSSIKNTLLPPPDELFQNLNPRRLETQKDILRGYDKTKTYTGLFQYITIDIIVYHLKMFLCSNWLCRIDYNYMTFTCHSKFKKCSKNVQIPYVTTCPRINI